MPAVWKKKKKALKHTGFKSPLGKCEIWWWEWFLALPAPGGGGSSGVPAPRPREQGAGGSSRGVWSHLDGGGKKPKIWIWRFFRWLNCLYPHDRDGALGYLLFDRRLVQTCRQFRKPLAYEYGKGWVVWGFFNHYYYYLIVRLLWYWAGQLGSGADLPWPWAGARPALAAASSREASPRGPPRRAGGRL